jgi:hypothetical protein
MPSSRGATTPWTLHLRIALGGGAAPRYALPTPAVVTFLGEDAESDARQAFACLRRRAPPGEWREISRVELRRGSEVVAVWPAPVTQPVDTVADRGIGSFGTYLWGRGHTAQDLGL